MSRTERSADVATVSSIATDSSAGVGSGWSLETLAVSTSLPGGVFALVWQTIVSVAVPPAAIVCKLAICELETTG